MKTLLIVESPNKVKKLTSILGTGFEVRASVGHVRDLPEKELGIDAQTCALKYVETEKGAKVIAGLKEAVSRCGRVLLATDPDREGEAIAWHLADAHGLTKRERIAFDAITERTVRQAIDNPRGINMDLVHAQEARRAMDRIIGWKVSGRLSDAAGERLSAGRVQSPAVRLIVERDEEIRSFIPTEHFGAKAVFEATPGKTWFATWDTSAHVDPGTEYVLRREAAEAVAQCRRFTVKSFNEGPSRRAPAAPFNTVSLQSVGGARLKMGVNVIMDAAQKLFAAGHITYHRTDSLNLAAEGYADIVAFAGTQGWAVVDKQRTWKSKEGAQEGHEAIRPTHLEVREAGEDEAQRAVYRLIWQRAVASQLADARYMKRTAELVSEAQGLGAVSFKASGRTLVDAGWMQIYAADDEKEDEAAESSNPLPLLASGDVIEAVTGEVQVKTTKAPSRFTESTLVEELERRGIGRPSTYASIVTNIQSREYVVKGKDGFLSPAPAGVQVRDGLVGKFGFVEYGYTREIEEDLDAVAHAKRSYEQAVRAMWERLEAELAQLPKAERPVTPKRPAGAPACPDCKEGFLRRVNGAKGPFWGCSRFRDGCTATFKDLDGTPLIRKVTPCPVCSAGHLVQRKGPKGPFWGCSGYTAGCRAAFADSGGRPVLPKDSGGDK